MSLKRPETLMKYKLQEIINNLTKSEYSRVIKLIPELIGKCMNTFNSYVRIPLNAKKEIPYVIVRKLEIFFGLEIGGLYNIKIDGSYYKDLI